jgi:hypothetical protein
MKAIKILVAYRWPLYLGGLLLMSVIANAVLVYVATRPDAPRPTVDYYEKSLDWDTDAALIEASQQLGWTVEYGIPGGPQYSSDAPRPVDVVVTDPDGAGVVGLQGRLVAVRPADPALNQAGDLVELPHAPGHYRTLLRLGAWGIWEFNLDAERGALRYVYSGRVQVPAGPEAGGRR